MGAEKTPGSGGDSEGPRENDSHVRAWALLARFLDQHTLSDSEAVERFVADHPRDERALREILRGFHTIRDDANRTSSGDKITEDLGDNIPNRPGDNGHTGDSAGALAELLSRIREDIGRGTRFTEGEQIGSGGIGVVYKLWDANLRRSVAKKTIRADKLRPDSAHRIQWIARFLEEAQITAQLDHPGVVPIHDMGFESDGQIYFTMRFVRGDTLLEVISKSRGAVDGWNRTRVVSALLRVCETIAYAHGKDVIHRDLKPANIMVGRYGETYVMDWGLARKLGEPDLRDLRIRPATPHSTDVLTDARGVDDTGLFTVDGHAIGTPAYMAPEQAAGDLERIGKPADIYSLGAILYEILAGHPPYHEPGVHAKAHAICRWVLDGPPAKLHTRAPDAPPELIAICERAMARATSQRYASVEAMAEDLRAYLENRVVKAHRTGPISELRKWVSRNRLAAGIAGAMVVTVCTAGFLMYGAKVREMKAERERFESDRIATLAVRAEVLLEQGALISPLHDHCLAIADEWIREVESLEEDRREIATRMSVLKTHAVRHRENPELERRIAESINLLNELERRLGAAFRHATNPEQAPSLQRSETKKAIQDAATLPKLIEYQRVMIRRLSIEHESLTPVFENIDDESERQKLERYGDHISRAYFSLSLLLDEESGMIHRVRAIVANHLRIEQICSQSHELWKLAIESIADPSACPRYRGLRIPQLHGIVPLRRNGLSGLWEFWHVASGSRPKEVSDGSLELDDDSGLVLVLMPSDTVWMGHQSKSSIARFYYASATNNLGRHQVEVSPFLVSKYEMTQGQWIRLAGFNPSKYAVGFDSKPTRPLGLLQPVESLHHDVAEQHLSVWRFELPTGAQWLSSTGIEYHRQELSLTRAGEFTLPHVCENLYHIPAYSAYLGYDVDPVDGCAVPTRVGMFPANRNGLHDVMGNVSELCTDYFSQGTFLKEDLVTGSRTGARKTGASSDRLVAGPSFETMTESDGSPIPTDRALRGGAVDEACGLRVIMNIHTK